MKGYAAKPMPTFIILRSIESRIFIELQFATLILVVISSQFKQAGHNQISFFGSTFDQI
jgi:hypothetical protein